MAVARFIMTQEEKDTPFEQWSESRQREFNEYRQAVIDDNARRLGHKAGEHAAKQAMVEQMMRDKRGG